MSTYFMMSYADRVRQAPLQIQQAAPAAPPPETPLSVLASTAILIMKERWYKFNEERGLFYDYDYMSEASESEPEESEDEWENSEEVTTTK
jgi:hypothetical protein